MTPTHLPGSRSLPSGEYGYIMEGTTMCPCLVLRRRWFGVRVLRFKPYDGTALKTVRRRDLLPAEQANAVLAFRSDPLAVLHMVGEESAEDIGTGSGIER